MEMTSNPVVLKMLDPCWILEHGSLNVPIEHHPTIRYMVNGYYKVMSNIPKMGQLPTPVEFLKRGSPFL